MSRLTISFSDPSATSKDMSTSSSSLEGHKNEGFLKAAWHKLTHQHENLSPEESAAETKSEDKPQEEEPKKAAGSG